MTRYISGPSKFVLMTAAAFPAAGRRIARAFSVLAQPPRQLARLQASGDGASRRYTFQAVVTIPAQRGDDASQPGPGWHGAIQAGTGAGRSGGLFSAHVDGWEPHDGEPAGGSRATATIIVFGPEPAACLPAGEKFILWRGRKVGHGVVSRRIFV